MATTKKAPHVLSSEFLVILETKLNTLVNTNLYCTFIHMYFKADRTRPMKSTVDCIYPKKEGSLYTV